MGMRDTVKRIGLHAGVRFFQAKAVWRDNWVIKDGAWMTVVWADPDRSDCTIRKDDGSYPDMPWWSPLSPHDGTMCDHAISEAKKNPNVDVLWDLFADEPECPPDPGCPWKAKEETIEIKQWTLLDGSKAYCLDDVWMVVPWYHESTLYVDSSRGPNSSWGNEATHYISCGGGIEDHIQPRHEEVRGSVVRAEIRAKEALGAVPPCPYCDYDGDHYMHYTAIKAKATCGACGELIIERDI
jgi:hypothetical protein